MGDFFCGADRAGRADRNYGSKMKGERRKEKGERREFKEFREFREFKEFSENHLYSLSNSFVLGFRGYPRRGYKEKRE